MDMLDFARGPALAFSAAVFVLGVAWRLGGVLRLPRRPDRSAPRDGAPPKAWAAVQAIGRGFWPRRQFGPAAMVTTFNGYVFHIGLALIVFGYAPHIAFVHRHLGLSWPALPDTVVVLAAGATIVSLLMALLSRLCDPVLQQISKPGDYIGWTLTLLPVITGMAIVMEPSAALLAQHRDVYPGPLAVHLFSFELLLIWFPFGSLMHAFFFAFSRSATGLRFSHRGVKS